MMIYKSESSSISFAFQLRNSFPLLDTCARCCKTLSPPLRNRILRVASFLARQLFLLFPFSFSIELIKYSKKIDPNPNQLMIYRKRSRRREKSALCFKRIYITTPVKKKSSSSKPRIACPQQQSEFCSFVSITWVRTHSLTSAKKRKSRWNV